MRSIHTYLKHTATGSIANNGENQIDMNGCIKWSDCFCMNWLKVQINERMNKCVRSKWARIHMTTQRILYIRCRQSSNVESKGTLARKVWQNIRCWVLQNHNQSLHCCANWYHLCHTLLFINFNNHILYSNLYAVLLFLFLSFGDVSNQHIQFKSSNS